MIFIPSKMPVTFSSNRWHNSDNGIYIFSSTMYALLNSQQGGLSNIVKSSPVTGLEWARGFQEVKVPRFHDNGTRWW
jgi:hypothetical protein